MLYEGRSGPSLPKERKEIRGCQKESNQQSSNVYTEKIGDDKKKKQCADVVENF